MQIFSAPVVIADPAPCPIQVVEVAVVAAAPVLFPTPTFKPSVAVV